jgi:hypothetical protein
MRKNDNGGEDKKRDSGKENGRKRIESLGLNSRN